MPRTGSQYTNTRNYPSMTQDGSGDYRVRAVPSQPLSDTRCTANKPSPITLPIQELDNHGSRGRPSPSSCAPERQGPLARTRCQPLARVSPVSRILVTTNASNRKIHSDTQISATNRWDNTTGTTRPARRRRCRTVLPSPRVGPRQTSQHICPTSS